MEKELQDLVHDRHGLMLIFKGKAPQYFDDQQENVEFIDRVKMVSFGYPGSISVLGLVSVRCEWNFEKIVTMYEKIFLRGWVGPKLWEVYKDICRGDDDAFIEKLSS